MKKKILPLLFLLGLMLLPGAARADVTITPTIVVIEGRRYADVSLVNTGNVPATYQLGWSFYKMEEGTGYYESVDQSLTDFDLTKHLALTPKRVTLGAESAQKIRMGLRLKGDPPPPGDYRAHLRIQEAPLETASKKAPEKGISVGVRVNVGFTIPVVYRVGESDATAQIGEVKTQINKHGKIEAVIPVTKPESKFGLIGAIRIYYGDKVIGQVKNANIFPEIKSRTFKVPLQVDKLSGGELRIVYAHYDPKKSRIFAEKRIPIGQ